MGKRAKNDLKPAAAPASTGNKLLLVDEDLDDLEFHSRILVQLGCEVVPCSSYEEAVGLLDSGDFDIVVVEQGGPFFKGRPVIERASRPSHPIPVLVLADCPHMRVYLDAMELGALDYLEKTSNPSEFLRAVESSLPRSRHEGRGIQERHPAAGAQRKVASIALFFALGSALLGEIPANQADGKAGVQKVSAGLRAVSLGSGNAHARSLALWGDPGRKGNSPRGTAMKG